MPQPINDAESYGVRVVPATVPEGEPFWRVTRVHHLSPKENHGLGHIFADVLDQAGNRIYGSRIHVTWDGGSGDPVVDKPANEPGTNFPMFRGGVFTVEAIGRPGDTPIPSDKVENLHTNHPAEGDGNSPGHHSFLVIFRKSIAGEAAPPPPPEQSVISGRVIRGAGETVVLTSEQGDERARATVDSDETYRFEQLPAGTYTITVAGTQLSKAGLRTNGTDQITAPDIELPPTNWTVAITKNTSGTVPTNAGRSVIIVSVIDRPALTVRIYTADWSGTTNRTGTKPEYGPFACEFAPLRAGTYTVEPEGLGIRRSVWVDGVGTARVEFRQLSTGTAASVITGVLSDGEGHTLVLLRDGSQMARAPVSAAGNFRFSGLPAGTYRLRVEGTSVESDDLIVDGSNQVNVSLSLAPAGHPTTGTVLGHVAGGTGRVLILQRKGQEVSRQTIAADGSYNFAQVPAGIYELMVADTSVTSAEFVVEPNKSTQVDMVISESHQQQAIISGRVDATEGHVVILKRNGQELSRTDVGDSRQFEFSGLPAGIYTVVVAGTDAHADHVVLDGTNKVTLTLSPTPKTRNDSVITGVVHHGAGHVLALLKNSAEVDRVTLGQDGRFLFTHLAAGKYLLHVIDSKVEQADLVLDGTNRLEVELNMPARESVLRGTVSHGASFTIVLWDNETEVSRQTLGPDGKYVFANLPAGTYRITIEGTSVQATGLRLDGVQEMEVNLSVPPPATDSVIWGVVSGGDQHNLVLSEADGGQEVGRIVLDESGQFRFEHLAAGTYRLFVEGTAAEATGLQLDGHNSLQANLQVSTEEPVASQPIDHYLLAGSPDREQTRVDLLLLQPFILTFAPTCGFHESEALHAKQVTIVGGTDAISEETEQNLVAAGCQIQRLAGNSSEKLMALIRARIEAGHPFD